MSGAPAPVSKRPAASPPGPGYRPSDWGAFGITAAVSLAVYVWTLAPGVTLEDSGEFVTAARTLGVPHPPGYPIWTILAWLWQGIVPWGNIAWRTNLFSAVTGALAAGLAALLVSRIGHGMAGRVAFWRRLTDERLAGRVVLAGGVAAGLVLAFSPVMWSQSVITEVYSLNALFLLAELALLYRWGLEPQRRRWLWLAAFVWGLALTNHQTLVLLAVALPVYVWLVDRELGRDTLAPILVAILLGVVKALVPAGRLFREEPFSALVLVLVGVAAIRFLYQLWRQGLGVSAGIVGAVLASIGLLAWGNGKSLLIGGGAGAGWLAAGFGLGIAVVICVRRITKTRPVETRRAGSVLSLYGAVLLGLCFYLYLPLASRTNPPMNWGYCRTMSGFVRQVTRGQYRNVQTERATLVRGPAGPAYYGRYVTETVVRGWGQLNVLLNELKSQFGLGLALGPLVILLFYREFPEEDRKWLLFLLVAFLFLDLGFLYLSNPGFEKQKLLTDRVFFLPGHCIYALWIGLGLMTGLAHLLGRVPGTRLGLRPTTAVSALVLGMLPAIPLWSHWAASEQRGHDFGYRYGSLLFEPGDRYPAMDRHAILFGGTDPGRFVPTYLIFVESPAPLRAKTRLGPGPEGHPFDRRDVFIINQTGLADGTYIQSLRDQYAESRPRNDSWIQQWLHRDRLYPADPIWLPTTRDVDDAFRKYVEELQTRPPTAGESVSLRDGRIQVQGVASVMAINGILSQDIFEQNKSRHSFYVEENRPMPWMYPHLEPCGTIFRIDPDPLPEPARDPARWNQIVERDRQYWAALTRDLLGNPRFRRDDDARNDFARLRAAIGGLYAWRGLASEAERAYLEAREIGPDSWDANVRLAQLYAQRDEHDRAIQVLEQYRKRDLYNANLRKIIDEVRLAKQTTLEVRQLEREYAADPGNLAVARQLIDDYVRLQRWTALDSLVSALVARPEVTADDLLQFAQRYLDLRRTDRVVELLTVCTRRYPQNPAGWYFLTLVNSLLHRCDDAVRSLDGLLRVDPPPGRFRAAVLQDQRFNACRTDPRFQSLLGPPDPAESLPAARSFRNPPRFRGNEASGQLRRAR